MSYTGLLLVTLGMTLAVPTWHRLRSVVAEGLHENHRGQRLRVSRIEQPRGYWGRILFMVSTCAAGIAFVCEATTLLHF